MGGWLGDRVGHRRLAMVACLCLAAGWLVFALGESMWRDDGFVYSMAIWEQLSLSVMTVSVVALCMSVVTPTAGASQFAAYMAMTNFSTTLGYSVPQWMPDGWATRDFYFAAVGIQCGCALLFWLVRPSKQPELQPPAWRGYLALGFLVLLLCGLTTYVAWRKLSG